MLRLGGSVIVQGQQEPIWQLSRLPRDNFRLHTIDLVGTNIDPPHLKYLSTLPSLKVLFLPGPMWNPSAGAKKDYYDEMRHLRKLTSLEKLHFSDHFITYIRFNDQGLDPIATLTGLTELRLRLTKVTGRGLAPFRNLRCLDLSFTPMDDAGMKSLENMTQLSRLYLRDTLITDEGLKSIRQLQRLTELDLHGTKVTDAGMASLQGLSELRKLNLLGTTVTDGGLSFLDSLPHLEELVLYRTAITNAGLETLKRSKQLRQLDLRYTRVTETGLARLKAALPECHVVFPSSSLRTPHRPVSSLAGKGEDAVAQWIVSLGGNVRRSEGKVCEVSLASTAVTDDQLRNLQEL
ncbi:MAG TPA: hypothetical protein VHP35_12610, partial [Terriglobia bacterium]|nr:hypothetical protein [Terriglobia bacterium]